VLNSTLFRFKVDDLLSTFKMMKRLCIAALVIFCAFSASAEKVFDFNNTCQQAYAEIIKLKLNNGQQLINQARQQNPDNLIPEMLEGYIDFFTLFFNEDAGEYKKRKGRFGTRLDAFSEGPANSPFYNYSRAITYLQRATVGIKFGERLGAAWDFKKAFSIIKDNRSKFPSFQPNNMLLGPLQVVIGSVPANYKWATSLFGMKGSINGGMKLMGNFINSNDTWARLFNNEASFYYCYLKFYLENKPDEVFQFIQSRRLDMVNNHLFTYLGANLGINNKQNEFAENVIVNRNKSPEYINTAIWDFEMGYAKLNHLKYQEAINYFTRFINNFKGKFYVKDALQKLSWAYYLKGDMAAAERTRQQLLKSGNTDTDADKKANKEAKTGIWPSVLLLKSRLLSDGGYHKEALNMLQGKSTSDFPKPEEALEFTYRVARIYDDLERDDSAINAYLAVIKLGVNRKEYYAARAALQIGFIYEKRGQSVLAISYFQKVLDMDDHDYKDSLDQRAKSGIQRCKGE
jgi:tetratricopeptide (TPR) repeat protein